jgi:hypothetical protein
MQDVKKKIGVQSHKMSKNIIQFQIYILGRKYTTDPTMKFKLDKTELHSMCNGKLKVSAEVYFSAICLNHECANNHTHRPSIFAE